MQTIGMPLQSESGEDVMIKKLYWNGQECRSVETELSATERPTEAEAAEESYRWNKFVLDFFEEENSNVCVYIAKAGKM